VKTLHIFKTGSHTASCGTTLQFDETVLAASAAAYDPGVHEAPIVVGHPKDNGPAFGWIQGLSFADGNLDAEPHQINPEFEALVKSGAYKKISASFYSPDAPSNPVPGAWYLRHVGFLGAQPPAIKGLEAIGFNEGETGIVEFSSVDTNNWVTADFLRNMREWLIGKFGKEDADEVVPSYMVEEIEREAHNPTPEVTPEEPIHGFNEPNSANNPAGNITMMTPEQITAKEAEIATKEAAFAEREIRIAATEQAIAMSGISTEIAALVKAGKVLPAETGMLASFMQSLDPLAAVEFEENGSTKSEPARQYLVQLLGAMPSRVDFSERTKSDGQGDQGGGISADDIAQRATQYKEAMRKTGITMSFTQAVNACIKGKDEPRA
jgi:hypothetical protein